MGDLRDDDGVETSRVPIAAAMLGAAGLLPLILALFVRLAGGVYPDTPIPIVLGGLALSYAALILSFLGGIWWGVAATRATPELMPRLMGLAVLPSLIAWGRRGDGVEFPGDRLDHARRDDRADAAGRSLACAARAGAGVVDEAAPAAVARAGGVDAGAGFLTRLIRATLAPSETMGKSICGALSGGLMLGAALAVTGCHHRSEQQQAASQPSGTAQQIAWREGDVDDAFAEAKEANKPVLLYWGAKWCPPCNLMKSTLFKDPAFIAQTRAFIPVHLDGDAKGAQSWGEKFGIQGYPTVILLRPDHSEITRLSGGSTASTLADVLRVAATRTSSTEDLLKRADDPSHLSADDWRLLSSFDWFDDPKHFGDPKKTTAFVARLAEAAPDPAMKRHFALTSLFLAGGGKDVATLSADQLAQVRAVLPRDPLRLCRGEGQPPGAEATALRR